MFTFDKTSLKLLQLSHPLRRNLHEKIHKLYLHQKYIIMNIKWKSFLKEQY